MTATAIAFIDRNCAFNTNVHLQCDADWLPVKKGDKKRKSHLYTSHPGRREAVLECPRECIQEDALAGRLTQVAGQIAKENCGVRPDGWLFINLHTVQRSVTKCRCMSSYLRFIQAHAASRGRCALHSVADAFLHGVKFLQKLYHLDKGLPGALLETSGETG